MDPSILGNVYQITTANPPSTRQQIVDSQTRVCNQYSTRVTQITEFDAENTGLILKHRPQIINLIGADHKYRQFMGSVHIRHISNALKHMHALKHAGDGTASKYHLVLEDDALMVNPKLHELVSNVPDDADIVFLGYPIDKPSWHCDPLQEFANSPLPACDSYLVSPSAAQRLFNAFLPITAPTHIHFSSLIESLGIKCYMSKTPYFVDGSKVGFTPSQLSCSNVLIWNTGYMSMARSTTVPTDEFDRLWGGVDPKIADSSPDFLILRARNRVANGDFEGAKALYGRVMHGLESDGCIINQMSPFLN